MKSHSNIVVAGLLSLAVAGCGLFPTSPPPAPVYDPPTFGAEDSVFTDTQLRATVFSSYEKPPGFYWEDRSGSAPYYVNTISIHDESAQQWGEFSTEDPRQARAWVDTSWAYGNEMAPIDTSGPLITERYFEFEPIPTPGLGNVRFRVHRASYIDRSMGRPVFDTGYLGKLQVRPVDAIATRGLAEYLWFLASYAGSGGWKPLSSFSRVTQSEVLHSIYAADVFRDIELGGPALIHLYRTDYHVDTSTGAVVRDVALVRTIHAAPDFP